MSNLFNNSSILTWQGASATNLGLQLGSGAAGNNTAVVTLAPSNSATNWQLGVNVTANSVTWTPSTAGGGTTFTTPAMTLSNAGLLTATTFSGSGASLTSIPNSATTATSANTASAIVARDGSGNFTATTITANLTGNASGSAGSVAVGGITGLGTGVATALAVNVGSAGAFVTFNGALGTPSSGTVTNLTGTADISVSGTGTWNAGAVTSSGAVNGTVFGGTGQVVFAGTGRGTNDQLIRITNTGGDAMLVVERSAGGAQFAGSTAYATVLGTANATPLEFGANGTKWMSLSTSGLLTVSGFGTHGFIASGSGDQAISIRNTSANAAALGKLSVGNNTSATIAQLFAWSSGNTGANGWDGANVATLYAENSAGLSIASVGDLRLYSRNALAVTFGASQAATFTGFVQAPAGLSTDSTNPGATNFRVAGTSTLVGTVTATGKYLGGDGSTSAPTYGFSSDTNTGMYWLSADRIAFVLGSTTMTMFGDSDNVQLNINGRDLNAGQGPFIAIGRNSDAVTPAPGCVEFTEADGSTEDGLYPDNAGDLRIYSLGCPSSGTIASGTVVGTQTSTLDTKRLIGRDGAFVTRRQDGYTAILPEDAYRRMVGDPIYRYDRYGKYSGSIWTGPAIDTSEWYGQDPDAMHPHGRSGSLDNLAGYTMLSFRHVDARIAALEAELKQLKIQRVN